MRHMHAGHDPGGGHSAGADSACQRSRDPQRAGRESVPLHGLREDFRGGRESLRVMRGYVPGYELIGARSLEHALSMVGEEWRPFAGGTDLMVLLEAGKLQHRKFVSIWGLAELKGIVVTPEAVTAGALTTYTDVLRHPVLLAEFPLLA